MEQVEGSQGQANMKQKIVCSVIQPRCTSAYLLTLADGHERKKHGLCWIPPEDLQSSSCWYSAYRILWLSPCDKIAQNRVLWLFFKCPKCPFSSQELSSCDNYRPMTIFWPCPEVVTISDNYCVSISVSSSYLRYNFSHFCLAKKYLNYLKIQPTYVSVSYLRFISKVSSPTLEIHEASLGPATSAERAPFRRKPFGSGRPWGDLNLAQQRRR